MAPASLYRRILGARFEELPGVLQRFHDAPGGGRARGTLQIERSSGRLRNALASLLELPKAGEEVSVRLEVILDGDRERWVRLIGGCRLETVQWARGDLLMESLGRTIFSSALVLDGAQLRYEFRRAWVAGVRLPRRLSPAVEGRVDAGEDGWRVTVRIAAPVLGELIRYTGWVELE